MSHKRLSIIGFKEKSRIRQKGREYLFILDLKQISVSAHKNNWM